MNYYDLFSILLWWGSALFLQVQFWLVTWLLLSFLMLDIYMFQSQIKRQLFSNLSNKIPWKFSFISTYSTRTHHPSKEIHPAQIRLKTHSSSARSSSVTTSWYLTAKIKKYFNTTKHQTKKKDFTFNYTHSIRKRYLYSFTNNSTGHCCKPQRMASPVPAIATMTAEWVSERESEWKMRII